MLQPLVRVGVLLAVLVPPVMTMGHACVLWRMVVAGFEAIWPRKLDMTAGVREPSGPMVESPVV